MVTKHKFPGERRYEHDCDACAFLGTYADPSPRSTEGLYDLYYCHGEGVRLPTVIARFSSRGPDYTSGLVEGAPYEGPLAVAVVRTIKHLQAKLDEIHNLTKK